MGVYESGHWLSNSECSLSPLSGHAKAHQPFWRVRKCSYGSCFRTLSTPSAKIYQDMEAQKGVRRVDGKPEMTKKSQLFKCLPYKYGAQKRTRTSTSIRTLAPEASASTNSAIWARKSWNGRVSRVRMGVNWILAVPLFLRAIPGQRGEMASCSYRTAAVPLLKGC